MMNFKKRLAALESKASDVLSSRWRRIFQASGQSQEDAIAQDEAANGPIGNDNLIIRSVVDARKF